MKLSIVTTLYRSAPTIAEFHRRAVQAAEGLAEEFEIVMVNDGSPDDSLNHALALMGEDRRIVIVDLSRNFGHHRAMMTGLAHATGDLVFLIDSDLEEPPELLGQFYDTMRTRDADVVYGVQRARRGGLVERVTGEMFFRLTEMLSDHTIPRNVVTARLMTREYVSALIRYCDREFIIAHLWAITGFDQIELQIDKLSLSPTTYSLRQRVEMAVKHITITSTKLLYLFFYFGIGICFLSFLVTTFYFGRYITNGIGVDGFTSIIISVWFFGGMIVLILGVLGIYIANILSEVRRRPYTVVRRVHRSDATPHIAQEANGRA